LNASIRGGGCSREATIYGATNIAERRRDKTTLSRRGTQLFRGVGGELPSRERGKTQHHILLENIKKENGNMLYTTSRLERKRFRRNP